MSGAEQGTVFTPTEGLVPSWASPAANAKLRSTAVRLPSIGSTRRFCSVSLLEVRITSATGSKPRPEWVPASVGATAGPTAVAASLAGTSPRPDVGRKCRLSPGDLCIAGLRLHGAVMIRPVRALSLAAVLLMTAGCGAPPDEAGLADTTADATTAAPPEWEIDPTWPPTLPNDWILGDIRGLFVDDNDHLWVIHMPSSLTPQEIGAAVDPPIADCCHPAPPVLELDPEGNLIQAWGGPGEGYTWFDQEHGIYVDHNQFVWMGTSNGQHVMKFTQDGRHVLTIGEPEGNRGSNESTHLGGTAALYVAPSTR